MKPTKPTPDRSLSEIREEFDRAMNTPSPNPRYGGLTPIEALQRSAKQRQERTEKKSKPDLQAQNGVQLST
ncbi:MAG: hypothetical protein OXH03_11080 [Bacteroidetes bacterium]|nr:hypothetical protein [Bacteroidota bacterium]